MSYRLVYAYISMLVIREKSIHFDDPLQREFHECWRSLYRVYPVQPPGHVEVIENNTYRVSQNKGGVLLLFWEY